ncbi:MAG: LPS-assembly protein LptD [Caulobacteraceae bacterium]
MTRERGATRTARNGPPVTRAARPAAALARAGCAVGVAALAGLAGVASAQSMGPAAIATPPAAPVAAPPDDGLKGGGFYLEADQLVQDDAKHLFTAQGSVEARYKGRVLRGDQVTYDSKTGVVTARGHVTILNPDGTSQFAEAITLDKDMSEGVALGFSTRLQNDVKIAAASVRRQSAQVTELDRAIYTPCAVCATNKGAAPTWSIKARKVIEDHKRQTIYFQHAVIQVKGMGVLLLPVFWAADPTATRKSGFLLPVVTVSGERGISYQQPYYQVISPSQDITLTPQINTKVNPFLNIDYRKRFYSGVLDIRAGYTYDRDFTSGGVKFGPLTSRSYILGSGVFQFDPNWQWGFTAERASDKLIFDKYSIGNVFTSQGQMDRGLYAADDQRLISQIYAVRQDQLSYLSVAAISVQGLRAPTATTPGDDQSTFPTVAPLIEGRYEPAQDILGGRLRIDGSAVVLTRAQAPADTGLPGVATIPGLDSRRATLGADWQRTLTFANGLRVQPFAQARADVYNVSDLAPGPSNATIIRGFGILGANVSYPLIKQSGPATWVLEPLAQIAIAPNTHLDPRIPNEDSQVWEFDETNLFDANRSPGYDLYEGGQSVTVGGRATLLLADGRGGSVLVGRRFGAEDDPAVPERTGLQTALSDYIFAFEATPIRGVSLFSRLRLDSETFALNRLESGVDFTGERANGYISYLREAQSPTGVPVSALDIHGEAYATKHWGVTAYAIVDGGAWRRRDFGVVYRDDCVRLEVLYRHDETFNGTLGPSTSVVLRLNLATLGNSGYSR